MKAVCWHGTGDVRIDTVPDPKILDPKDIIIQVTASGICGSDLHLYDGLMPTMEAGDVIGHEPMGIVVEVGAEVKKFKKGDRVVVPFVIACGCCFFCQKQLYSACDTTNPGADLAKAAMGQAPAGGKALPETPQNPAISRNHADHQPVAAQRAQEGADQEQGPRARE